MQVILLKDVEKVGLRGEGELGGGTQFVPTGAAQESADFPAAADDDIPF